MAQISITNIAEYLDKMGFRYRFDREGGVIQAGFAGKNGNYSFFMTFQDDSNTFLMFAPGLAKAIAGGNMSDSRLASILELLLDINYRIALGAFDRDRSDGEIRFSVCVPAEDGSPTEAQFAHLLGAAVTTVDHFYADIQQAIFGGATQPATATGPRIPDL